MIWPTPPSTVTRTPCAVVGVSRRPSSARRHAGDRLHRESRSLRGRARAAWSWHRQTRPSTAGVAAACAVASWLFDRQRGLPGSSPSTPVAATRAPAHRRSARARRPPRDARCAARRAARAVASATTNARPPISTRARQEERHALLRASPADSCGSVELPRSHPHAAIARHQARDDIAAADDRSHFVRRRGHAELQRAGRRGRREHAADTCRPTPA